jgi:hypothetical protein
MPIALSSITVVRTAPIGTVVGALSLFDDDTSLLPANFALTKGAGGLFAVDGSNNLVTEWVAPVIAGYYSIRVRASAITKEFDSKAHFVVFVVASPTTVMFFQGADMANTITSITLVEGGPAVHVTVGDQNGVPIPPANISWASSSVVNIVPDATGFNISGLSRSTPFSFQLAATDVAQSPNVSALLTINIVLPAITGLTFMSP